MNTSQEEVEKQKKQEEKRKQKEEEKRQKIEEYKNINQRKVIQSKKAAEAAAKLGKKKSEWYTDPYVLTFGGLGALMVYVFCILFLNRKPPLNKTPVIDQNAIAEHNAANTWSQGPSSFWQGATLADAKKIFTTAFSSHSNLLQCVSDKTLVIPEKFDVRKNWPKCFTGVVDQNRTCDGAYAITLAQTFAERECIANGGEKLKKYSAQELLSCDAKNEGCRGGYLNHALDYMVSSGLAGEECLKYTGSAATKCMDMCDTPSREKLASYCVVFGEEDIKREIMSTGPVVGIMEVYTDFLNYKSGVYDHGEDVPKFSGYHAVKVIGWGVDNGEDEEGPTTGAKYWLVQNTWGDDWGINGVAKVMVGDETRRLSFEKFVFGLKTQKEVETLKAKAEEAKKKGEETKTPEDVADIPDVNLDDDKKEDNKQ